MATTIVDTRLEAYKVHHLHRPSFWQRIKRDVVEWLSNTCCCGSLADDLQDVAREEEFQRAVTRQRNAAYLGMDGLKEAYDALIAERLEDVVGEYGYDALNASDQALHAAYYDVSQNLHAEAPVVRTRKARATRARALASAATVAAVITVVDSKLGLMLEDTAANHMLVDKVARQVMKTASFRTHDIALHIAQVVECYFQCRETLEMAGGTRRRIPTWVLDALGYRRATARRKA